MQFLRNKEIQIDLLIYLILLFVYMIVWSWKLPMDVGIFVFILLLLAAGWHFFVSYKRYCRLSSLNDNLDQCLHGKSQNLFEDCVEGEIAILATNLKKLILSLNEQISSVNKSKTQLADAMADISHQIKTPLTSMNLLISRLQNPNVTKEQRLELVRELNRLITKIEWLIYALLRIAKLDAGAVSLAKEKVFLKELFLGVYEHLSIPLELREVSFSYPVECNVSLNCDAHWTQEALENIIKNCMEHTGPGGKVKVQVEDSSVYTAIVISDTGCGINTEDLPHIFERFYRGKQADKNSVGIGLALARQIILAQNGTISAENKVKEKGALFTIKFYKTVV